MMVVNDSSSKVEARVMERTVCVCQTRQRFYFRRCVTVRRKHRRPASRYLFVSRQQATLFLISAPLFFFLPSCSDECIITSLTSAVSTLRLLYIYIFFLSSIVFVSVYQAHYFWFSLSSFSFSPPQVKRFIFCLYWYYLVWLILIPGSNFVSTVFSNLGYGLISSLKSSKRLVLGHPAMTEKLSTCLALGADETLRFLNVAPARCPLRHHRPESHYCITYLFRSYPSSSQFSSSASPFSPP